MEEDSALLLDVVALLSLPVASGLMLYNKYAGKKILKNQNYDLVVRYGAIVGFVAGLVTLAYALVPITTSSDLTSVPVRNFAHDIFLVLGATTPALMILLITCFPVKIGTLITKSCLILLIQKWQKERAVTTAPLHF